MFPVGHSPSGFKGGPHGHGKPEGRGDLRPRQVLTLDEGRPHPQLGENFDEAGTAEDETE